MPTKSNLRLVKPTIQKRAVGPLRRPNSELRSREHLTETEVEKLIVLQKATDTVIGTRRWSSLPIDTAYGLRKSATCDGIKSTSLRPLCTFIASRMESRVHILFAVTNYGRYGSYNVRLQNRRLCS